MAALAALPETGQGLGAPANFSIPPITQNRPSYASTVRGRTTNEELIAKISSSDGIPTVTFESQDLAKAAFPFRFALILKFSHSKRPSIEIIRSQVQKRWGIQSALISLLDGRHVLLRCSTETDMIRALSRENTRIEGMFYKISRWTPEFDLKHDASLASIWVQLKGLPPHLYPNAFLKNIAKPIGNFLRADNPTLAQTNTTRARFCVEVDLMHSLPDKINVNVSRSKVIQQTVTYETIPKFCDGCMLQGHAKIECTKLNPALRKEYDVGNAGKNQREWREKIALNDNDHVEDGDFGKNKQTSGVGDGNQAGHGETGEGIELITLDRSALGQLGTAGQVFDEMPDPVQLETGKNEDVDAVLEAENMDAVGNSDKDPIEVKDSEGAGESSENPTLVANTVSDGQENDEVGSEARSNVNNAENELGCHDPIRVRNEDGIELFVDFSEYPMEDLNQPLTVMTSEYQIFGVDDEVLGSPDDEVLVPNSQVQLVNEASILLARLEGKPNKKNKEDLNTRKLVAKISKSKIALLPAGPLKEKLATTHLGG